MDQWPVSQVDVFTTTPYAGNPVAVVLDAGALDTGDMQRFRAPGPFVRDDPPVAGAGPVGGLPAADFATARELPFAGHPTLAAATPGCRPMASHTTRAMSCSNAEPA